MKGQEQNLKGERLQAKKEAAQTESLDLGVEVLEERIAPYNMMR